jgi:hypothetical protein
MKHCSGACDQGRKECVTPAACERPDDDDGNDRNEWMVMVPTMLILIACCCYLIWELL